MSTLLRMHIQSLFMCESACIHGLAVSEWSLGFNRVLASLSIPAAIVITAADWKRDLANNSQASFSVEKHGG